MGTYSPLEAVHCAACTLKSTAKKGLSRRYPLARANGIVVREPRAVLNGVMRVAFVDHEVVDPQDAIAPNHLRVMLTQRTPTAPDGYHSPVAAVPQSPRVHTQNLQIYIPPMENRVEKRLPCKRKPCTARALSIPCVP